MKKAKVCFSQESWEFPLHDAISSALKDKCLTHFADGFKLM